MQHLASRLEETAEWCTVRDDGVADRQDPEELLDDLRAALLQPGSPHDALVVEVEAALLPGHCCWVLNHIQQLPCPAPVSPFVVDRRSALPTTRPSMTRSTAACLSGLSLQEEGQHLPA